MELSIAGIADNEAFEAAGIRLPNFDVAQMQAAGSKAPQWIHIGPGNIFRVYLARMAAAMVEDGEPWSITAVAARDGKKEKRQLAEHDLLSLGVILNPDGTRDMSVIAGINSLLTPMNEEDFGRLMEIAAQPQASFVSLTITEKGYSLTDSSGALSEAAQAAIAGDPHSYLPHVMALVASFLLKRFESGAFPINFLSGDNFSHNGDKLRDSVLTIARGWVDRGAAPAEFVRWLEDRTAVGFPISVIDKITPRPSSAVSEELRNLGVKNMELTEINGVPLAGFVNAEPTEYLLIEDAFANAPRPPFESYGVVVTSRQVCDDFENMKVTTCLNPLHTALAVAGCLLRFPTIDSEMRDPALAALVHELGWKEGLPVVTDPGV
ncbi:MAG: mannitol dehydrogenase family protein, partial [Arcanobacterium sp.]|nr:mannitol dehydrogenase family protein [Arcanobacterium sp.]